jgi:biopolymer transport protein TolR
MAATSSPGRRTRRTKNEINMVPFIDVMLVLLIIFMVTAPLISPSQINLPSAGQSSKPPDKFVQVLIDKDADIQLKLGASGKAGNDIEMSQLVREVEKLRASAGGDPDAVAVVIAADKNLKYDTVMQAMNKLKDAGVKQIALSVQPTR